MKPRSIVCVLSMFLLLFANSTLSSAQRFVRAPIYSAGNPTVSVASGDFNGDGNADLVFLGNADSAVITIRLGVGNGKFNNGQQITLTGLAGGIVAGDWNKDGLLDLAATTGSTKMGFVSILLGNGDGTFNLTGTFSSGGAGPLVSGDLNGDGYSDLVIVDGDQLSILLGLGGGKFGNPTLLGGFVNPAYGVALADLNLDGKFDILAYETDELDGPSYLRVFVGNGDGTFASPKTYNAAFYTFAGPAIGDFNHDGIPDVALSGLQLSVYIGRGDGTLKPPVYYDGPPSQGDVLAAVDLNRDGNLDLISVDEFSNDVSVNLGNADGTFKGASIFGVDECPRTLAVADFNNDGNLDAAVPDLYASNFVELAGDGTGKFVSHRDYVVPQHGYSVSIAAGYMDADKNLDLVLLDDIYHQITVFPGNKNGAFRPGTTYPTTVKSTWLSVADLNGDGKNDVVTADGTNNTVSVYLGNGNGTLQNPVTYATGSDPTFVASADVNGDGKLDLITANTNSFSVLLASGSGYLSHVDYTVSLPAKFAFGDFNADGKLDLVIGNIKGTANVFTGNGDGTFTAGMKISVGGTV
ncbi:MAG: VCBS repeat-containing protein, partial [Acidobacteriales bacterium]|nr:VCBS repeat-containing protein [Terriglobales bacterium]